MNRRALAVGLAAGCLTIAASSIRATSQIPGFPGFGSQTAAPTGNGVILGRAIDAATGRPVAGVLVALTGVPKAMAAAVTGDVIPMDQFMSMDFGSLLSGVHQVLTDAQGRFVFMGLPKGSFSLAGEKPGWSGGNYGQRRPESAPQPLELSDGEQATDITLELWKNSSISGVVTDEAGEPIVGLSVRALRRTWLAGHPRFTVFGFATTDDRGAYRISGLRSGDYVISIPQTPTTSPASTGAGGANVDLPGLQALMSARAAGTDPNALLANIEAMTAGGRGGSGIRVGNWVLQASSIIPPVVGADGRMLAYRTTYFPTATMASQGTPVTVTSGDDRTGVDLQLRPLAVSQISGVVSGIPDSPAGLQVHLLPSTGDETSQEDAAESATATTAADGSFTFLAVPAGQYVIRVVRTPRPASPSAAALAAMTGMNPTMIQNSSGGMTMSMGSMNIGAMMGMMPQIPTDPTLFAVVPVSVGDADVTGLNVALRTAFRISGRVEFEGSGTKPTFEQLKRVPIAIERADLGNGSPVPTPMLGNNQSGQFDANGQFTTFGLLPGKYFVRVPFSTGGWTLKSAMLGGKDVADLPLELENADVAGVVLTFTDQRSELSGTVRDAQGAADGQAAVVVFPTNRESWTDFGSVPRKLRVTQSDRTGKYTVTGLPAGTYFIAAVPVDVSSEWQNPQVLDMLSRGATRVTMGDGEKRTQDLKTSR